MGVLGKDLLDLHRPRTNTRVEFGVSGYWVESCPELQPYGTVLTELLNLAIEHSCTNCTAALLAYKNDHFADFDPMDVFTLE